MLLKLPCHQPHSASLEIKFACSFNVLNHYGGKEGDVGEHPGPAAGAGGVVAPEAGGAQEVAPGAAVDRAGGWHLQAHWTPHPLLQLLHQLVQRLALLLQYQLLFHKSLILCLPVSLAKVILDQGVVVFSCSHGFSYSMQLMSKRELE